MFASLGRVACALLLGTLAVTAAAQDWPSKTIRIVVPYPPGGATDVATRAVADRLGPVLGQSMIVENKAGAGGAIGIEHVAKSDADGYTLLVAPDFIASAPHVYKLNFDPMKDLVPVVQLSRQPVVLAVHPSLGVKSVAELVALAKQKPGLGYATSGAGSQQHIAAEWFARLAGVSLTHVPYKGGGQAITDFVGGQVPIASLGSTPVIPHHKGGRVQIIAQTGKARAPSLPDVPTYEEAGLKGLVLDQWLGVFVPAGTPAAIIQRLNAEVGKALKDESVQARFAQAAMEPIGGSAEAFGRLVHDNFEMYRKLIADLKIRIN